MTVRLNKPTNPGPMARPLNSKVRNEDLNFDNLEGNLEEVVVNNPIDCFTGVVFLVGLVVVFHLIGLVLEDILNRLGVNAAIDARIPYRNPPVPNSPEKPGGYTALLVMVSLLLLETFCSLPCMKRIVDRLKMKLENRGRKSKLYQAYSEARSFLEEPHAESCEETLYSDFSDLSRSARLGAFSKLFFLHLRDVFLSPNALCYRWVLFVLLYWCGLPWTSSLLIAFFTPTSLGKLKIAKEHVLEMYHSSLLDYDSYLTLSTIEKVKFDFNRAWNFDKMVDLRIEKAKQMAEQASDDLSVSPTESSFSTIDSKPCDESLPPIQVIEDMGPLGDLFMKLGENSTARTAVHFISNFLTAPSWSSDPTRCALAHATNFSQLLVSLRELHGPAIVKLLKILREEAGKLGGMFGLESEGEERDSWIQSIGSGLESLQKFETTPVGSTLNAVFGFVCTIPILLSDIFEADSYIKMWRVTVKGFQKSGASLSTILKNTLYVYRSVISVKTLRKPGLVLRKLFETDDFHTEYLACNSLLRDISLGTMHVPLAEMQSTLDRFRRLEKRAISRVDTNASPADVARAKECSDMTSAFTIECSKRGDGYFPMFVSYNGLPGCAKSTHVKYMEKVFHNWTGQADIMQVSEIDITQKFDNQTTNATTMIVLDDGGNIVPEMRARPLSAVLLLLGQSKPVEVPKADLKDKGKHFYNPTIVVTMDNEPRRGIDKELLAPMAGFRRLGINFEVKVKPEYANESGMLDPNKARGCSANGETQLFRPYRYMQKPNENVKELNLKEGDDPWMDHVEYLTFLRKKFKDHFAAERLRLEKMLDARKQENCKICDLCPPSDCPCGQNFIDADLQESRMTELAMGHFSAVNEIAHSYVDRFALYLATNARVELLARSRIAAILDFLLSYSLLQMLFSIISVMSIASLFQRVAPENATLAFISFSLYMLTRRIERFWNVLMHSDVRQLLGVHISNVSFLSTSAMFSVAAISAIISIRPIWNALVGAVPISAESKEEERKPAEAEDSLQTPTPVVTPLVDNSPAKPIWALPRRVPIIGTEPARTITTDDLVRLSFANTRYGTFVRHGSEDVGRSMHVLLLNDYVAVTVAHAAFANADVKTFTFIPSCGKKPFRVERSQMFIVKGQDVLFFYINKPFGHVKDLTPYLARKAPLFKQILVKMVSIDGNLQSERVEANPEKTEYKVGNVSFECLLYRASGNILNSGVGQCGLPYVTSGTMNTVAAIHCAGCKNTTSYAAPISLDDYTEAVASFQGFGFHIPLQPQLKVFQSGKPVAEGDDNPGHPIYFLPDDGRDLEVLGYRNKGFTPRSNLRLNPSLDAAVAGLKIRMLKEVPKMRWKHSCRKVLLDATSPKPSGSVDSLVFAKCYIRDNILPKMVEKFKMNHEGDWLNRPLSLHEVANGIPETPIEAMDKSKSACIGGKKGDYVEGPDGQRVFVDSIVRDVEEAVKDLKEGRDPGFIPVACLKDEPLKPGKEVRYFYNSPIQQYILATQYLQLPLEVINHDPLSFGTAIGLDPVGASWEPVCGKFSGERYRNNCFDIDYQAFDANQSPWLRNISSSIFVDILELFEWDEEEIDLCRRLLSSMDNAPINMAGVIMYIQNLLASGYKFTAHRNGAITLLLMIIDYHRFIQNLPDWSHSFEESMLLLTLGDDMLSSVSDEMRKAGWTIQHFVETAAEWGLTVTTANKDFNFEFKSFDQCEFLKRYYNYHDGIGANVFVASPKSYLQPFHMNIPNKEIDDDLYYSDQSERAILEAFYGGRKSMEAIQSRLEDYYSFCEKPRPSCLDWTWDELCEKYSRDRPRKDQLFEIKERGISLISEYDSLPMTPIEEEYCRTAEAESEEVTGSVDHLLQDFDVGVQETGGLYNENASVARLPVAPSTNAELVLQRRLALNNISSWPNGVQTFPVFREMMAQPIFRSRLENIAYLKAGIDVEIDVVCPSTFAGVLMCGILCYPDTTVESWATSDGQLCNLSQRKHIILRAGARETLGRIHIPFFFPYAGVHTFNEDLHQLLPSLYIVNLTPLLTVTTGSPGIQIKIYGSFTDLTTFGATAVHSPAAPYAEMGDPVNHWWILDSDDDDLIAWKHHVLDILRDRGESMPVQYYCYPEKNGFCYLNMIPPKYHDPLGLWLGPYPRVKEILENVLFRWIVDSGEERSIGIRTVLDESRCLLHAFRQEGGLMGSKELLNYPTDAILGADEPSEKISNTVKGVGKAMGMASKVPGLGMLSLPSEIVNETGNLIAHFGFSKQEEVHAIGNPSQYLPNGMGRNYPNVLAVNPGQEVSPGVPGFDEDELDFNVICQRWSLIATYPVPHTTIYSQALGGINVTPTIVVDSFPASVASPALFHTWWRGTMEYKFIFVAPSLVTAKLAIFYDPLGDNHGTIDPIEEIEDHMEHVILDSTNVSEAVIHVGWSQPAVGLQTIPTDWNGVKHAELSHVDGQFKFSPANASTTTLTRLNDHWKNGPYDNTCHNGRLVIKVIDPVTGGVATTPPICQLLVFARGGSDIKFAGYNGSLPGGSRVKSAGASGGPFSYPLVDPCPILPNGTDIRCDNQGAPAPAPTAQSGPPTLAPTQTPVGSTPAPVSPTTAPASAAPTTGAPTTGAPTTGAPTTAAPVVEPTAAPVICTGESWTANELIGSDISPGVNALFNPGYTEYTKFTGKSDATYNTWCPSYCEFFAVSFTVISGTWTVATNLVSNFPISGSDTVILEFDPVPTGQSPPYNINATWTGDSPSAEIHIRTSRLYGVPAGYRELRAGIYRGASDALWVTNSYPQLTTTGLDFNQFATKDSANDSLGNPIEGWRIPQGWHVVVFSDITYASGGTDPPRYVAENKSYGTITCYGYVRVRQLSTGTVVLETTVNRWRTHTFIFDKEGFSIETPDTVDYPKGMVRYYSMISPIPPAPFTGEWFYPPPGHVEGTNSTDLNSNRRRLRDLIFAEAGEVVEMQNVDDEKHHYFGGGPDDSEFFSRMLAGESVVSFRPELKIPFCIRNYDIPPGATDTSACAPMYTDGDTSLNHSLYWFLYNSFCAIRGGIVNHYIILGDGAIEVSRAYLPGHGIYQMGGICMTDSRVNPRLTVRFPDQYNGHYHVAAGVGDEPVHWKHLRMYGWDTSPRFREYFSTAEDFNLIMWRGAPELESVPIV